MNLIQRSKTEKISLYVLLVAAICWLGGINVRSVIGFSLLQIGTLDFKPNIHPYVERAVFGLVAQSSVVVNVAYIIVWVSGIVFLIKSNLRLRDNGWLMMCAILFYLFTPVEIYTMVLDIRMWLLDIAGSNDLVEFRKLFIHRLAALSGVPFIALLCYYTALFLVVFQPLGRRRNTDNLNIRKE
jgi:hypothetical protein